MTSLFNIIASSLGVIIKTYLSAFTNKIKKIVASKYILTLLRKFLALILSMCYFLQYAPIYSYGVIYFICIFAFNFKIIDIILSKALHENIIAV